MRSALVAGLVGVPVLVACGDAAPESPALEPDIVARGRAVYMQQCASCHGTEGEGASGWQTPNEAGELPAPPHDSMGHTWKHSDAMLYRIVRQGWRDPFNRTQRLTMPAFEDVLSPQETRAVITYLKTLWTPEQRAFQRQETQDEPFPPEAVGDPHSQR